MFLEEWFYRHLVVPLNNSSLRPTAFPGEFLAFEKNFGVDFSREKPLKFNYLKKITDFSRQRYYSNPARVWTTMEDKIGLTSEICSFSPSGAEFEKTKISRDWIMKVLGYYSKNLGGVQKFVYVMMLWEFFEMVSWNKVIIIARNSGQRADSVFRLDVFVETIKTLHEIAKKLDPHENRDITLDSDIGASDGSLDHSIVTYGILERIFSNDKNCFSLLESIVPLFEQEYFSRILIYWKAFQDDLTDFSPDTIFSIYEVDRIWRPKNA